MTPSPPNPPSYVKWVALAVALAMTALYWCTPSRLVTQDGAATIASYNRYKQTGETIYFYRAYHLAHPLWVPAVSQLQRAAEDCGLANNDKLYAYYKTQAILGGIGLAISFLFFYQITLCLASSLLVTALLGFSFGYWNYTVHPEVYILPFMLGTCTIYALYNYSQTGATRHVLLAAVLYACVAAAHVSFFTMVPGTLVVFLYPLIFKQDRMRHVKMGFMFGGISGAFWLAILAFFLVCMLHVERISDWWAQRNLEHAIMEQTRYSFKALLYGALAFLRNLTFAPFEAQGTREALLRGEVTRAGAYLIALAVLIPAVFGCALWRLYRNYKTLSAANKILTWTCIVWCAGVLALVLFYDPGHEEPKYFGPLLAPFTLFIALALCGTESSSKRLLQWSAIGLTALIAGVNLCETFIPRSEARNNPDWVNAQEILREIKPGERALILTYSNTVARYVELESQCDMAVITALRKYYHTEDLLKDAKGPIYIDSQLYQWSEHSRRYLEERKFTHESILERLQTFLDHIRAQAPAELPAGSQRLVLLERETQ